jgi:hypothetical protein
MKQTHARVIIQFTISDTIVILLAEDEFDGRPALDGRDSFLYIYSFNIGDRKRKERKGYKRF